jgi:putative spermidine/putrescine transport system ATP-binding protein
MTVGENVAFGLEMRKVDAAERRRRVADALELVHLGPMAARYPRVLSGGQRQRVALARALVIQPPVLLLDEPMGALDAKLREAMQLEVRELQRTLKVTTIFVTHDQTEAMVTADRIAVLNAGRVEQFDSPVASYDRPASLFVADFIGRMNRLSGKVLGTRDAKPIVSFQGVEGEASGTSSMRLAAGQPVIGVLRPERTRLAPPDRAEGPGLQGTVREVIFVGEKLAIFVDTAHGSMVTTEQNSQGAASTRLKSGDPVRLEWSEADLLLFPVQ